MTPRRLQGSETLQCWMDEPFVPIIESSKPSASSEDAGGAARARPSGQEAC